jgi:ABC-type glycerol-3-phosphate transport system permease component
MDNSNEITLTNYFLQKLGKVASYFIFILWALITIAPLLWMTYSSFKTNEELTKDIYSFIRQVSLINLGLFRQRNLRKSTRRLSFLNLQRLVHISV